MVNRHRMIVNSQPIAAEVSGTNSVQLSKATSLPLKALVIKGSCSQASTPTPDAPVWPVINNGTVGMAWQGDGIAEGDGTWHRVYINVSSSSWNYYEDASSSIRIPIQSGQYRLYWDETDTSAVGVIFRVGFVKTDTIPSPGTPMQLYKADGTTGLEVASSPQNAQTVELEVSGAGINYMIIQISGSNIAWSSGDFSEVWARISHLHLQTRQLTADGTPEVLTMSGKNLFDVPIESNFTINARGEIASNSSRSVTQEYIPVNSDTTYTLSYTQNINNGVFYYNENKEFLSYLAWETKPRTFTTPTNARFVRFSFATINEITETQLELGDMMTAYEPYHTSQAATVPDLYAVGDYKDEYDAVSGQITRRVGVKVLDGTEDWFAAKGYTDLYGVPVADGVFSANQLAISTHYAGTTAVNNVMATNTTKATHASILAPGKISVYIKDTVNGTSLEDWKAYLAAQYAAGTPIIIIYPLITPAMEQLTPQKIKAANTITTTGDLSVSYWKAPF